MLSLEKTQGERKHGHSHPNPGTTRLFFVNPSCPWPPGFMVHHNDGILAISLSLGMHTTVRVKLTSRVLAMLNC